MTDTMTRQLLASGGITFDGKRDLYEIFGYKRDIGSTDYRFRYERGDISQRIVDAYPSACWSSPPAPTDDKDNQDESQWELAFAKFAKEKKLWQVVRKADVLAQLNTYAVILVGVAGTDKLDVALTGKPKVIYFRAFGADSAPVETWVTNENDPRFGLPASYKIEVKAGGSRINSKKIIVHHSRIVHIAERTLDDPINGVPFLQSIWNRLDDLEKVAGSSGEIWWLNSRSGLNLNIDADVELDPDDKAKLEENVDDFQNKLSRVIRTQGVDVKTLEMKVPSPKDHAELYLSLISGATGIPKRILMGSERGELSSNQDENNFDSRVKERRSVFCEPEVLDPLMQMLILLGAVKSAEYEWVWPDLNTLSKKDTALVAKDLASAIATFTNAPNAESVVTPMQFVEDVLQMEFREDELEAMAEEEDDEIEIDDKQPTEPAI